MSDGYTVDGMHFILYPHKTHAKEIPRNMPIRAFAANGQNKFAVSMMKSLSDDHDHKLEYERQAEEALASAKRSMEATYTPEIRHETSSRGDHSSARIACGQCFNRVPWYIKCYHCKRKLCPTCCNNTPWADTAPMCHDCLARAQAA